MSKIVKDAGVKPNQLEEDVNKALMEIESNTVDLRSELKEFKFSGAKEIEAVGVGKANKNAVVVFVPFKHYRNTKKSVGKLIQELQKKFQKKHIVIVANRTILDKNFKRKGIAVRPRSRSLTSVHEAILDDVIYPNEITAKRTSVNMDGSKVQKIKLKTDVKDNKKEKEELEEKMHIWSSVYRQLTNKFVEFST